MNNNLKLLSTNLNKQLLLNNLIIKKTPDKYYNYVENIYLIPRTRFIIKNNKLNIYNIPKKILEQNVYAIQEEIVYWKNYNTKFFLDLSKKKIIKLNNKLYYISLLHPSNFNYFHFIFETVIYVFMIYKKFNFFNLDKSKIPVFIIEKNKFNYILKKIFKNITLKEVLFKKDKSVILFCKNLILPEIKNYNYCYTWNKEHIKSNCDSYYVNKEILFEFKDYVKKMFEDKNECNNKYTILIKRKRQRCMNINHYENYIIKKFPKNKIIFFEDLDFVKQVKLMSNCNLLIMVAGSGFINTLFMPENSNIITLVSNNNINHFKLFEEISNISNKKLNWIKGPILKENKLFLKEIKNDNSIYNIFNLHIKQKNKKHFLTYHPYNYKADFKTKSIDDISKIIENIMN